MKVKALVPFYHSKTGPIKRGQIIEIPEKILVDLAGIVEVQDDKRRKNSTTGKGKGRA